MRLLVVLAVAVTACSSSTPGDHSSGGSSDSTDAGPSGTSPDAGPAAADRAPFATAQVAEAPSLTLVGDGDLWPSCWSSDDNLYAAWGDGWGFDTAGKVFTDIGVARISGSPDQGTLAGHNRALGVSQVWSGAGYNRKPTGMLCQDGDLYLAVQDLALDFNDAPAATIARSHDGGATWDWDHTAPMFPGGTFTTIFFLDVGKDGQSRIDDYVYAYGLDGNWRDSFDDTATDPTALYLARVPRAQVQDRSAWQFFTGMSPDGAPTWSADLAARAPVLEDTRRVYAATVNNFRASDPRNMTVLSQGSVVYDAPLNRYIYTSWTEYTFEFYQAPRPWGPWRPFLHKDYGDYPWAAGKNGGYATTIPSKFISADGTHMMVQSNTFVGGIRNYSFSLRNLELAPYQPGPADNRPGEPIPTAGGGAVPIAAAFHFGHSETLGDGTSAGQSEDSWTGGVRPLDFWGYTWPRTYHLDRVAYTTGARFADGGWFESLGVEVRRDGQWQPVANLTIDPPYPMDASAGDHTTYHLRFTATDADGVRIVGAPGGPAAFTSIAELTPGYSP